MAYAASGFMSVTHMVGQNRIHHYKSNDLLTAIDDADYFLAAYEQLKAGDLIAVSSDMDGTILPGWLIVTASTSATVTTTLYPIGS